MKFAIAKLGWWLPCLALWAAQAGAQQSEDPVVRWRQEVVEAITRLQQDSKQTRAQQQETFNKLAIELQATGEALLKLQQDLQATRTEVAKLQAENAKLREDLATVARDRGQAGAVTRDLETLQAAIVREAQERQAADQALAKAVSKEIARIPAPAPAPAPAAPAGGTTTFSQTYVVKKGDTLSAVAAAFGLPVEQLKAANNLRGDTIQVGQKLQIPEPAR